MQNVVKRLMIGRLPVMAAVLLAAEAETEFKIRDACQPAAFNLPPPNGAGPGTCATDFSGNVSFSEFINQLTKHQDVPLWQFNPRQRTVDAGRQLTVENYGGETHTFTRVQAFGGGFVLPLNGLSGNPIPAPECLGTGVTGTFVPPGVEAPGPVIQDSDRGTTIKVQCCIHPWMRSIKVR